MAEITADMIKDLRIKTGAGLLDCKKALMESNGDIDAAVEFLRKSGAAKADKKTGRITSEGRISLKVDGNKAVMVEVNSETDFVAKNPEFQAFSDEVAALILQTQASNLDALSKASFKGATLEEALKSLIAKIGENISVRRFAQLQASADEVLGSYVHMGNKIAVLVKLKGPQAKITDAVTRDVAMHVAASAPQYLTRENIPAEIIAKEKEIYLEQMKDSGKPANVLEKIIEGKVAKFADEVCLVNQVFVKDPTGKQTVNQFLKQIDPSISVVDFVRYQVGEGLAKKEQDFASEVAKAAQS